MKLPHQWGKRTKGIDIPKRLKKLNVLVLDFHNKPKPTKPPKKGDGARTNSTSGDSGRKVPQDIASSILFQSTDFSSLKSLILVNKCFFNAFQSYRVSLMDAVALNMFGVETVDHAIALAGYIDKPSSVMSKDGTIVLAARGKTTPLTPGTIKKAQFVYQVVNKWVELYEMKQMWLNVPKKKGKAKASATTLQKLSPTERTRFCHALVIYWIYSFCASHIEKHKTSAFSMDGVKKSGLCGYFSNFELVELMAVFSFFKGILQEACDDCQMSGDDGFLYWQGYCLSQGPVWLLRLLDDYTVAFGATYGGQHEGFALYDAMDEGGTRGIDIGFGEEGHLSDAGHQALADEWQSNGIDGEFRPVAMVAHIGPS